MPDITNLATTLNTRINEVKTKIPRISGLATTSALTAVENNLVKKTDHHTKVNETERKITDHKHDKYINTPELVIINIINCQILIEKLL